MIAWLNWTRGFPRYGTSILTLHIRSNLELFHKKKAKMGQNRKFKTKHCVFRAKIYARPENFTPLLEVIEVTFRRSEVD